MVKVDGQNDGASIRKMTVHFRTHPPFFVNKASFDDIF